MNSTANIIRRTGASLIGVVLLFSGLLKHMDPVGTSLIVEEYFKFLHIGFLGFSAPLLAVIIALLETLTGAALVSGICRRFVAVTTMALMTFFTVLTLALVIFNPEMDCGCFGEMIHLTHLQSLLKNIIILAVAVVSFLPLNSLGSPSRARYVGFALAAVPILAFCTYFLFHLPAIDFTDMAPGTTILAADSAHPAADAFEPRYLYEKDGVSEYFTLEDIPDSSWNFVKAENRPDSGGESFEAAPALSFCDMNGNYCDECAATGKVVVVSVYSPDKVKPVAWQRAEALLFSAAVSGATPILLSTVASSDFLGFAAEKGLSDFLQGIHYTADYRTLVSLNRSNGGATYISDGEIIRKWHSGRYPVGVDLSSILSENPTGQMVNATAPGRIWFQAFALYCLSVLMLI